MLDFSSKWSLVVTILINYLRLPYFEVKRVKNLAMFMLLIYYPHASRVCRRAAFKNR
ncbi:hypothetical protein X975_05650, partial [Stegodyphus mimosarum]